MFGSDNDGLENEFKKAASSTQSDNSSDKKRVDLFDPFNDKEFATMGGVDNIDKEMSIMLAEEKDAFQKPLNNVEVKKLEDNGKTLLDEITSGLKSYG